MATFNLTSKYVCCQSAIVGDVLPTLQTIPFQIIIQTLITIEAIWKLPVLENFRWTAGSTGVILGLASGRWLFKCRRLYMDVKKKVVLV